MDYRFTYLQQQLLTGGILHPINIFFIAVFNLLFVVEIYSVMKMINERLTVIV